MALLERHGTDVIWYTGAGGGEAEAELVEDTGESWIVRDGNYGEEYELIKGSMALRHRATGGKGCDSVGVMETTADVDRLIPEFEGWGKVYLDGLRRLIDGVGGNALVLPYHSPGYICACYALGFEKAMESMMADPDFFVYVCDRYAAGDELRMRELAAAGAEAVFIADGWASCDIISPSMIERFALPYQAKMIAAAHKAGLKIVLWNEGDITGILDKEAALGMDGFAFEQPRKGVELSVEMVREAFGAERCLWGNCDSELLLLENDAEKIKVEVEKQIRQSGRGNPFVFSTGSPIPSNVEVEAVDVMIKAVREFHWD